MNYNPILIKDFPEAIRNIFIIRKLKRQIWKQRSLWDGTNWFLKRCPVTMEKRWNQYLLHHGYPVDVKVKISYFEGNV